MSAGLLSEQRSGLVESTVFAQRERQRRTKPGNAGILRDSLLEHRRSLAETTGLERDRGALRVVAGNRIGLAVTTQCQRGCRQAIGEVELASDDRQICLICAREP